MLAATCHFYWKLARFLATGRVIPSSVIREDYDRLSRGYDENFSAHVARHSREMVSRLGLRTGDRVLDLACGTGTISLAAARAVGPTGEVIGVDQSSGMLSVAERKRATEGYDHLRFLQGDMQRRLDALPLERFDAVTCGWAIGYVSPPALVCSMAARLRPGGRIGLIENRRNTLHPVHTAAVSVARTFPNDMQAVMDLHLRLPRGKHTLRQWFRGAGLSVTDLWEGEQPFSFSSGRDVLDWVLRTGASAGFDKAMASTAKARCDDWFVNTIEKRFLRKGQIRLAHRFAAGTAVKPS